MGCGHGVLAIQLLICLMDFYCLLQQRTRHEHHKDAASASIPSQEAGTQTIENANFRRTVIESLGQLQAELSALEETIAEAEKVLMEHGLMEVQIGPEICQNDAVADDDGGYCSICFNSLDDVAVVLHLQCGHTFHRECLQQCREFGQCPMCRCQDERFSEETEDQWTFD